MKQRIRLVAMACTLAASSGCGSTSVELPARGYLVPTTGRVVDLSHSIDGTGAARETQATALVPLGEVSASKLIAPLLVLDFREALIAGVYAEVRVEDVQRWEIDHGTIQPGSLWIVRTGFTREHPLRDEAPRCPTLSAAALEYLVLNRQVLAIGSDAPWVGAGGSGWQLLADPRSAETTQTAYYLENLTGLDLLPERGAMGVVGLPRARDHRRAVVRVTAIVPRER